MCCARRAGISFPSCHSRACHTPHSTAEVSTQHGRIYCKVLQGKLHTTTCCAMQLCPVAWNVPTTVAGLQQQITDSSLPHALPHASSASLDPGRLRCESHAHTSTICISARLGFFPNPYSPSTCSMARSEA